MKTKTDISYGVIPVRRNKGGEWEVFVIHQFSGRVGNAYWTFPKGHVEGDENPKETATREVLEETGLRVESFLSDQLFTSEYTFVVRDTTIEKTAAYFVATVSTNEAVLQVEEVQAARWVSLPDAEELLDFPASRTLLQEAGVFLQSIN